MGKKFKNPLKKVVVHKKHHFVLIVLGCLVVLVPLFIFLSYAFPETYVEGVAQEVREIKKAIVTPPLDKVLYDKNLQYLAHNATTSTTTIKQWPVKTAYPNAGAILPFKRIVAYYGNLLSRQMGVLGEYPEAEMKAKLNEEVQKWTAADPKIPAIPALHYIAVTAQGSSGADGKYRLRMPDSEIDKVMKMAEDIHALVFLDIQVGLSTAQIETPLLEKYLKFPNVHFGMDPEFSMKTGKRPGTVIGSYSATDINFVAEYLAKLVRDNNLPPKILIVHRFTGDMVTNYKQIKPLPEVQIVMDMDGWGAQARKINTYQQFIAPEPVQFTGFKLFYKNDFKEPGSRIMTPEEVIKLRPSPIYIQYQ